MGCRGGATGEAFLTGLSRAHMPHPPLGIPFCFMRIG